MNQTGTIKRLGDLLTEVREGKLIPKPAFQRHLVWTNADKEFLIDSVLKDYPFPEVFVAAAPRLPGRTDRQQLLVDGQQRIQTLLDYVDPNPKMLHKNVKKFVDLSAEERDRFLDYKVAVRDLGTVSDTDIREVFRRINTTNYVLKSMEVFNAQYTGEYIRYCIHLSQQDFFTSKKVFREVDIRRMQDRTFCVTLVTTILCGAYYKRDERNAEYLELYNEEFPKEAGVQEELDRVFAFVESLGLPPDSRAWKQLDLLTLLVEVHVAIVLGNKTIDTQLFASKLDALYKTVNEAKDNDGVPQPGEQVDTNRALKYLAAATRAANDKAQRVARGEVIAELLNDSAIPSPAGDGVQEPPPNLNAIA